MVSDSEEQLIKKLKSQDIVERENAAVALGKKGGENAVEPLVEMLKDQTCGMREAAARSLGLIESRKAVGPLIEKLQDEKSSVRTWAALALASIGDFRAIGPLKERLKEEFDVRDSIKLAIEHIPFEYERRNELLEQQAKELPKPKFTKRKKKPGRRMWRTGSRLRVRKG